MIKISGLKLAFTKEYYALYNINLEVQNGKTLVLLGDSESGKTTLLRAIAGLEKYGEGEIYLNEMNLKQIDFSKDVNLGYISYKPVFFNNKSVYQNLEYVLKIRKNDEVNSKLKINQALKNYGIEAIKDLKIKEISAYQKILVQLARLSLRPIEIYLIDNIFKNLTTSETEKLVAYIKELQKQSATFIIGVNTKELANEFSTDIIKLKFGSIVTDEEV
ncbi:MAG: ATP-binding cassette domain-containing protein [Spirochaetales bacterium]